MLFLFAPPLFLFLFLLCQFYLSLFIIKILSCQFIVPFEYRVFGHALYAKAPMAEDTKAGAVDLTLRPA